MPAHPVEPLSERTRETDLLLTLVADVAAGRTRLQVLTDDRGNGVELRLTPLSVAAQAGVGECTPESERTVVDTLSPRERTVLRLIADGRTNRQIAAELHLAEKTIRNQLSLVFAKLGIERRSQAAALAVRHGLTDSP